MDRTLYELVGADDRRFSPYCWRTRMALAHKGLDADIVPIRFSDKDLLAFSGQGKVPVLVDGARTIHDSWAIACYLDDAYPERPALFGNEAAKGAALFINSWVDRKLMADIVRMVVLDIHDHCVAEDRDYFRRSREERFGATLEKVVSDRATAVIAFRAALDPLRATLKSQPYICGATPAYADYIVFSAFQWARSVSPFALLEPNDPLRSWLTALLDAFDGLARGVTAYDT